MDQPSGLMLMLFKKDATEKTVFYPWSIFGKGVIVESTSKFQELRDLIKKLLMFFLPALLITMMLLEVVEFHKFQIILNISLPLLVILTGMVCYYACVRKATSGMTTSNEQLKRAHIYEEMAKSYSVPTLILIEMFFLVFLIIAVWFIFIKEYMITACLATLVIGACCYLVKNIIAKKIQQLK